MIFLKNLLASFRLKFESFSLRTKMVVFFIACGIGSVAASIAIALTLQFFFEEAPIPVHMYKYAVKIMNAEGTAGGTGVIIKSTPVASLILTNAHICELFDKKVGRVITDDNDEYIVASIKVADSHDLCILKVFVDLGLNITVAKNHQKITQKLKL